MLCNPTEKDLLSPADKSLNIARSKASSDASSQYVVNTRCYSQQYNNLYSKRMLQSREILTASTKQKWGNDANILTKIIDCEVLSPGDECILIGTIYKEMKLKPSVLDEFKDNYAIGGALQPLDNITGEDDFLTLEDESGRIRLGGIMSTLTSTLVTGVVVGVRGNVESVGTFTVNDVILCGDELLHKRINTTVPSTPLSGPKDQHILLVSGLKFGSAGSPMAPSQLFSAQLLADFVAGRMCTGAGDDSSLPAGIVKVIVAGNSVVDSSVLSKDKAANAKQQAAAVLPLAQLDMFLAQLLASCPVDVLPGDSDPSSINFPQQPLHPCLLPHSVRFKNGLHLATNPYETNVTPAEPADMAGGNLRVIGHSGKPLTDIAWQTTATADSEPVAADSASMDVTDTAESAVSAGARYLSMLENTVKWGNLCPTAPDSLPCYPLCDRDPFVLDLGNSGETSAPPGVVFAGNAPAFASSLFESKDKAHKTRVVCVPAFHLTRQAVLVNINTLDTHVLTFE